MTNPDERQLWFSCSVTFAFAENMSYQLRQIHVKTQKVVRYLHYRVFLDPGADPSADQTLALVLEVAALRR